MKRGGSRESQNTAPAALDGHLSASLYNRINAHSGLGVSTNLAPIVQTDSVCPPCATSILACKAQGGATPPRRLNEILLVPMHRSGQPVGAHFANLQVASICNSSSAGYYAWYELYPAGSVEIASVQVFPSRQSDIG